MRPNQLPLRGHPGLIQPTISHGRHRKPRTVADPQTGIASISGHPAQNLREPHHKLGLGVLLEVRKDI